MVIVPDDGMSAIPQITMMSTSILAAVESPSSTFQPLQSVQSSGSSTDTPTATFDSGAVDINVSIETENFDIVPKLGEPPVTGEGHVHFFLDSVPPTFPFQPSITAEGTFIAVQNNSLTWTGVLPGVHIISAELVNNDHTAVDPPVVWSTLVTVMPVGTPSPSPVPVTSPEISPLETSSPSPSLSAAASEIININLVVRNFAFNMDTITVTAGAQVNINFDNMDSGIPHNFSVYTDSSASISIFQGEIIIGPDSTTYTFTAPDIPGEYYFRCDPHPTIMNGKFIVR
jgi:plastocyanin